MLSASLLSALLSPLPPRQKSILGEDGEEGQDAPGKSRFNGQQGEEEVVGFDEADWDKKKAEVPFL